MIISNAGKLTVEFVRIRNLDGFSGDYNRGLAGGDATVTLTDNTYQHCWCRIRLRHEIARTHDGAVHDKGVVLTTPIALGSLAARCTLRLPDVCG